MSMNSQKTLIVVLAAAVVIGGVAYLGVDFPTGNDQASGTIVPANAIVASKSTAKMSNWVMKAWPN